MKEQWFWVIRYERINEKFVRYSMNSFFPANEFSRHVRAFNKSGTPVRTFGTFPAGLTSDSRFANCNRLALQQLRAPWYGLRETWLHRGKMIVSNPIVSGPSDGWEYPQMREEWKREEQQTNEHYYGVVACYIFNSMSFILAFRARRCLCVCVTKIRLISVATSILVCV